ncbi:MAG: hypothetical protein E7774_04380 [Bradyrhizobium sp.]|nr:MAG: hypothetical protein E7774_04380 [Bradyrhizobium sp.]
MRAIAFGIACALASIASAWEQEAQAQDASQPRMTADLAQELDRLLIDQYFNCLEFPPKTGSSYVARVRIALNRDGSLSEPPVLVNPPIDEASKPIADNAIRAALKCNPLKIPEKFSAYWEQWRAKTVRFYPADFGSDDVKQP